MDVAFESRPCRRGHAAHGGGLQMFSSRVRRGLGEIGVKYGGGKNRISFRPRFLTKYLVSAPAGGASIDDQKDRVFARSATLGNSINTRHLTGPPFSLTMKTAYGPFDVIAEDSGHGWGPGRSNNRRFSPFLPTCGPA